MAKGINKVHLSGNLGNDPEVRYTNGEKPMAIANFSIATSYGSGEKEKTEWHRLVAFGKAAEIIGEYAKKGSKMAIVGRLQTRKWEKDSVERYTTEVVVEEFDFSSPRNAEGGNGGNGGHGGGNGGGNGDAGGQHYSGSASPDDQWDDEIPF